MIEVHFHCIPRVDDGPASWDEAVALCRAAAAEGTTRIVATPTSFATSGSTRTRSRGTALVHSLNERLGGTPRVLPGCEYYFSDEVVALAKEGIREPAVRALPRVVSSCGVRSGPPAAAHRVRLPRAAGSGLHPVVAHPERHLVFARQPERLAELVPGGSRSDHGRQPPRGLREDGAEGVRGLLPARSRARGGVGRALDLAEASPHGARARVVREKMGADAERGLFVDNPEAILASRPIPYAGS